MPARLLRWRDLGMLACKDVVTDRVRWEVGGRSVFAGGRVFGADGPFVVVKGSAHYRFHPDDPRNQGIVDLSLAPRDAAGWVRCRGDFTLIAPENAGPGGKLLIDVPNRGRPLALAMLNGASEANEAGDGLLLRRGFAIASIGWQWDVAEGLGFDAPLVLQDGRPVHGDVVCRVQPGSDRPFVFFGQLGNVTYPPLAGGGTDARLYERADDNAPLVELPRSSWRFARERGGVVEASDRHIHKDGGFEKGRVYMLVYRASGARVTGCGLLALRDAAASLRAGEGPNGAPFARVFAFGASQTGRVLRHLLHLGLNEASDGKPVFDGVHIHIAGAQRGDFNHRFAQPSSAGVPAAGQQFPFAGVTLRDPLTGVEDGLHLRVQRRGVLPKVVATNTSWEYWRGDAALAHIRPDGAEDLPEAPDERHYLFAGTHHIGGVLPPTNTFALTGEKTRHTFNVVDHSPLTRAAFANLDAWVSHDEPPPPSAVPMIADGTLVSRAAVLAKFEAKGIAGLNPARLGGLSVLDLGAQVTNGVCAFPAKEGAPYARLVCDVDETLNEVAGLRLPDIGVPVGCHTGWNPRHPANGEPELPAIFVGFTRFVAAADLPAAAEYEERVRAWTRRLVAARHILAEDEERVVGNCLARYAIAAKPSPHGSTKEDERRGG